MGLKTTYLGLLLILTVSQLSMQAQQAVPSGPAANIADQNAKISSIYVDQSSSALAKKDWTTMSALLRVALEFDPGNSDALFLQGEMYEAVGGKISQAIDAYDSALNESHWDRFGETQCRMKLAPLLIRTKQYGRALAVLQGLGTSSASYLENYSDALVGLGRDFKARQLLATAVQAYPTDARLASLRIRLDTSYRSALTEQYLSMSASSSISAAVLVSLIRYTRDAVTKRKLLTLYDKSFSPSPEVYGESLLASGSIGKNEVDTYVSDGLLSNGNLTGELYRKLPSGPTKSYLAAKIGAYSGKVTLDTNDDGIPEETAEYRNGTIDRLVVDSNQDDVPEYDIGFVGGIPRTVEYTMDGLSYAATYGQYPFLSTATSHSADLQTTYSLESDRISLPLFGGRSQLPEPPTAFPPLVRSEKPPSKESLFAFAEQVETKNLKTNTPVSLWKKSINDILLLDKEWQSGQYTYKAVYHGGVKFSAEIDLDNDGYYEAREYYRNGKLYKITYDPNRKSDPEFTLALDPYPILSWDFNQDGLIDEIEKRINPTTTLLEFSTKMNGVFDVNTKEVTK